MVFRICKCIVKIISRLMEYKVRIIRTNCCSPTHMLKKFPKLVLNDCSFSLRLRNRINRVHRTTCSVFHYAIQIGFQLSCRILFHARYLICTVEVAVTFPSWVHFTDNHSYRRARVFGGKEMQSSDKQCNWRYWSISRPLWWFYHSDSKEVPGLTSHTKTGWSYSVIIKHDSRLTIFWTIYDFLAGHNKVIYEILYD